MRKLLIPILIFSILPSPIMAGETGAVTGYEIPRFVSTKSIPVNVRTGPGRRYPVQSVYKIKIPVQIIDEYGDWRKVRDWQGDEGWIHRLLLSSKRLGMVIKTPLAKLYNSKRMDTSLEAKLNTNVVIQIKSCTVDTCKVTVPATDFSGYIKPSALWGVKDGEIIE